MLGNNNNVLEEVNNISSAIYDKSKRSFKYRKENIKDQAKSFSPAYRDFICKVINNKSLKIKHASGEGVIYCDIFDSERLFRKKGKNIINVDIRDVECLPHELGHQLDMYFGSNQAFTELVVLFDNQTFSEIVNKEFNESQTKVYDFVMNDLKEMVDTKIGEGSFDLLNNNMDIYHGLYEEEKMKQRRTIHKALYANGFVEAYYKYATSDITTRFDDKYHPIIDILSSKYDFFGWRLVHHSVEYYSIGSHLAGEFFANLFAAEVTSKYDALGSAKKLMPKSYQAFKKLFSIIYDHVQNDKSFSDLKTKEIEA